MQQEMSIGTSRPTAQPTRQAVFGHYRVELLPRRPYVAAYTPDIAVIGFAYESQTGIHAFASDRRTEFQARPNSLAYVPAGCDVFSQSSEGGEYLILEVSEKTADRRLPQHCFGDVIDPLAIDAAQSLRRLLLAGQAQDPLLYEHCVLTLQEPVSRVLSDSYLAPRASAWMTAQRMRLVDEIIEAKLDTRLTVTELADALGLSAGFFSRAFKAAVGKAPHDYIIDRRISRARSLLQSSKFGLSSVALDAGFASHAHMSAVFRSRLGISPSELRRRCPFI